jgi:hypothetical protein
MMIPLEFLKNEKIQLYGDMVEIVNAKINVMNCDTFIRKFLTYYDAVPISHEHISDFLDGFRRFIDGVMFGFLYKDT